MYQLNSLKGKKGYSKLKEGTLDRTLRKVHFGKGYGPNVRLITELNE